MPRLNAPPAEKQEFMALLEETIRRIDTAASGLTDAHLQWSPDTKQWSVNEILAHLQACADLWSHSIYAMLAENNPVLPLLDERKWAKVTRYSDFEFGTSWHAFKLKRELLLNVLRHLPDDAWARTADIGGRSHSIFSQIRRMALHESEHCDQIDAILKASVDPPNQE